MASPIPRTLAEPAAPAGPRAGLRRAIGARSPLRGTLPKALSLCKRSFVISRSLDYRLCSHAPGAHKVDVLGTGRRRWRARSPRTSSPEGKTISDKAECQ